MIADPGRSRRPQSAAAAFDYAPCRFVGCETEMRVPPGEVGPAGWTCLEHRTHQLTDESVCRSCGCWLRVTSPPSVPSAQLCEQCRTRVHGRQETQ